ncbi:MAG: PD-(D/E)XK nuclease family protein [Deltaproteobacteria bacterium]|nr:PD-(D/E)XK nuclease family protein [Deltaproteobacteria bacterium]
MTTREGTLDHTVTQVNLKELTGSILNQWRKEPASFLVLTGDRQTSRLLRSHLAEQIGSGLLAAPIFPLLEWIRLHANAELGRLVPFSSFQVKTLLYWRLREEIGRRESPLYGQPLIGWTRLFYRCLREIQDADLTISELSDLGFSPDPGLRRVSFSLFSSLEEQFRDITTDEDLFSRWAKGVEQGARRECWLINWVPQTWSKERAFATLAQKGFSLKLYQLAERSEIGEIRFFSEEFPEREVRSICFDIREKLLEGVSPGEMAVVVRSSSSYLNLLARGARLFELPFSTVVTSPLRENRLIQGVVDLLCARETTLPEHSPYFQLADRGKWISSLQRVCLAQNLGEGMEALDTWASEAHLKYAAWSGVPLPLSAKDLSAWNRFRERLDEIEDLVILGLLPGRLSAEIFKEWIRWTALEMYRWNPGLQEGILVSRGRSIPSGDGPVRYLYLPGFHEGHIPSLPPSNCLLSDRARREFNERLGEHRFPVREDHVEREKRWLHNLLLSVDPKGEILLSMAACDPQGRMLKRSPLLPQEVRRCEERLFQPHGPTTVSRRFVQRLFPVEAPLRDELLASFRLDQRGLSATEVDLLLRCPTSFFLLKVLGFRELNTPQELLLPSERGALVHAILRGFYEERKRRGAGLILPEEEKEGMAEILSLAEETFSHYEHPLTPEMWKLQREEIRILLQRFIAAEGELSSKRGAGWEIYALEETFGMREESEPLLMEKDGKVLFVRGMIDRIDIHPGRREFAVYDYKTGSSLPSKTEILKGESAQLPLYAEAISHLILPGYQLVDAGWYILGEGKIRPRLKADEMHTAYFRLKEKIFERWDLLWQMERLEISDDCPEHCACRRLA